MKSLITALQFLTRIPLPFNSGNHPQQAGYSLLWYPLIGTFIGAMLFGIALLMQHQPAQLTSIIILITWVLITGGLHLDGLADSADAWAGGYGNKEKTLAIMKDSHVGSLAVVVLVLVLLVKFVALGELLKSSELYYLIFAPMLGRCTVLVLFLTTPYVRERGLGSDMAKYLPRHLALIVLMLFVIPALLLKPIAVLMAIAMLAGLRYLMMQRIAGMTGDTIGASIEIIEAVVLLGLIFI